MNPYGFKLLVKILLAEIFKAVNYNPGQNILELYNIVFSTCPIHHK